MRRWSSVLETFQMDALPIMIGRVERRLGGHEGNTAAIRAAVEARDQQDRLQAISSRRQGGSSSPPAQHAIARAAHQIRSHRLVNK